MKVFIILIISAFIQGYYGLFSEILGNYVSFNIKIERWRHYENKCRKNK